MIFVQHRYITIIGVAGYKVQRGGITECWPSSA